MTLRPSFFAGRDEVTFYPGMTRLPEGSGPKLVGLPFRMKAPIAMSKLAHLSQSNTAYCLSNAR